MDEFYLTAIAHDGISQYLPRIPSRMKHVVAGVASTCAGYFLRAS